MAEYKDAPAVRRSATFSVTRISVTLFIIAALVPGAAGTGSADKALQTSVAKNAVGGAAPNSAQMAKTVHASAEARIKIKHHKLAASQALAAAAKSTVIIIQPKPLVIHLWFWCVQHNIEFLLKST